MRAGTVLVIAALAATGCAKKIVHPPHVDESCGDAGCGSPGGGTSPPVEAGTDGAVTEGGTSDAGVSLTGSVALLGSDDFTTSQPFTGTADIKAEAPGGGETSAVYNGQSFSMSGVLAGASVWFSVTPTSNTGDALPTLQPWDTTSTGPAGLRLVRASVIDQIFSVVTLPPQRDPTRGQLVLHFVDPTGKPLAGVSVTQSPGTGVIYDAAGSWTDAATATGVAGFAIVVNASPGYRQRIDLDTGSNLVYIEVQAAAGSVTLTDVPITP